MDPLLHSPIISDAAFETMRKLARCLVPPLGDWAPEIAAALRIISTQDGRLVALDSSIMPRIDESDLNLSLFESIVSGLSNSCRGSPLPADSFTVIFPVIYPSLYPFQCFLFCILNLKIFHFHDMFVRSWKRFSCPLKRGAFTTVYLKFFPYTWILSCLFQD